MGKDTGKRAARRRVAEISAAARDDSEKLKRATSRRLARLEKDLAAAHRNAERHRTRLQAATVEVERIRGEIADLLHRATEPAADGARKVGHAAGELLDDAAIAVTDAAAAVKDAAETVVGAARRAARPRRATAVKPAAAAAQPAPPQPAAPAGEPAASVDPASGRPRRRRATTTPTPEPNNG